MFVSGCSGLSLWQQRIVICVKANLNCILYSCVTIYICIHICILVYLTAFTFVFVFAVLPAITVKRRPMALRQLWACDESLYWNYFHYTSTYTHHICVCISFVFVFGLVLCLRPLHVVSTNSRAGLWRAGINVKKTDTYRPSKKKTQRSNGKIQSNFLISHIFRLMLFFHILQESNVRIRGGLHSVYITILEKVQGGMLTLLTSFLTWYVIVKSRRQWA